MAQIMTCKSATCPCMDPCPMTYALKRLGGKWKIPIIRSLKLNGPTRYNELLRSIHGITNTMLAASLKELENDGLVQRSVYAEVPLRVEYSLTENCQYLFPAFDAIDVFSRKMLEQEKQSK